MATNVLSQKIGESKISLVEAFMIKASEIAVDEVSSKIKPFGVNLNGTFLSGAVKGVSAILLDKATGGKYGMGFLSNGLLMDGMADCVISVKRLIGGNSSQAAIGGSIV